MRWYSYPAVMASKVSQYAADIVTAVPGVACSTYVNVLTTSESAANGIEYYSGHIVKLSIDAAGHVSTEIIDMTGLVAGYIGEFFTEPIQTIQELFPFVVFPIAPIVVPYAPIPALTPAEPFTVPHIYPPGAGAQNAQISMVSPAVALAGFEPFCQPSPVAPGCGHSDWVISCIHFQRSRSYSLGDVNEGYSDPPISHNGGCSPTNTVPSAAGVGSGHNGGGGIAFGGVPIQSGGAGGSWGVSANFPPETPLQGLELMYSLFHRVDINRDNAGEGGISRFFCGESIDERIWKPTYQQLRFGLNPLWMTYPDVPVSELPMIAVSNVIEVWGYQVEKYRSTFYPISPDYFGGAFGFGITPGLLMGGLLGGLTTQTTQTILANMLNMQSGGGRRDERRGN